MNYFMKLFKNHILNLRDVQVALYIFSHMILDGGIEQKRLAA